MFDTQDHSVRDQALGLVSAELAVSVRVYPNIRVDKDNPGVI